MQRALLIAAVCATYLLGWPSVAEQQQSSTHASQNLAIQIQRPLPPSSAAVNLAAAAPCDQAKPCYTKDASAEPPLPRWRRPEWVIVYVTIGYAIIAGFTLGAIKRQADTMETQAFDAKKSGAETLAAIKEQNDNLLISAKAATVMAMASNKSARAALTQIEMMKDKERARVEIRTLELELTRVSEEFWHVKTSIELRNVGVGRAYVRLGTGNLVMIGDGMPTDPYLKSLDVVDGFIDPTGPVKESFYFFQPDELALSDYSQRVWSGELQPRITGFIEYETVGTRFHRNFSYVWIGNGSPLNIGGMLNASEDFSPDTAEEQISFGYWLPNSIWSTGWSGDNEEYEMKPKKKGKK